MLIVSDAFNGGEEVTFDPLDDVGTDLTVSFNVGAEDKIGVLVGDPAPVFCTTSVF